MLAEIMNHPVGRILISVLLGFGLATLFRKVCNGKHCIVVKGPPMDELNKFYYKIDEDCYKYTPYEAQCDM